jgi:hypothetical protein
MNSSALICPSADCKQNAKLIGVVTRHDVVMLLDEYHILDDEFVQIARLGRSPRKRFRFADVCFEKGCANWEQGVCCVARDAVEKITLDGSRLAQRCSIRADCRWFRQEGYQACRVCGERLDWPRPAGVTFADGSAECMACFDREAGRLLAAGQRAVESADAVADPAEVCSGARSHDR